MSKTDPHKNEDREESLAERSARLEAEAAGGGGFTRTRKSTEPPAPEEYDAAPPEAPVAPSVSNEERAALKTELDKAKDQMMRALAEAENTRKRAAREREDASKFAVSGFARELLTVADNLRRALDAIPADVKTDARIGGLTE